MPEERVVEREDLSVTHSSGSPDWWIYRGVGQVVDPDVRDRHWPMPPPSRRFAGAPDLPVPEFDLTDSARHLGRAPFAGFNRPEVLNRVNAAIALARPLLVTGRAGVGKTALAYSIARELGLGRVLRWPTTPRSTVQSALYEFDSAGWIHAAEPRDRRSVGDFVRLGPLGTAFLPHRTPRVLVVEGIDLADFALPFDLLPVLADGGFEIPELARVREDPEITVRTADPGGTARIGGGVVNCHAFPLVIATSEGERDLPPAFRRRVVHLELPEPTVDELRLVVDAHFPEEQGAFVDSLVDLFVQFRAEHAVADVGRLLDAVHVFRSSDQIAADPARRDEVLRVLWHDTVERT
ncbi:hypothetical protein ALI22I_44605 [Saccharothrix sp. ALI-22-I]|nr:hypothetical protein ALI22I_44605 [Saccharothrix sp. ALI-22-I]